MVGAAAQDLPGDGAWLAAGQARHDRIHVACDEMELAVIGFHGAVEAVGLVGLHDHDHRPLFSVNAAVETCQSAGKRADTGLQEDVGGLLRKLLIGFQAHGHIALHDPGGDLLVAFPGGVLDHGPAVFLGMAIRQPYGAVIVQLRDAGIGTGGADILQPLLGAALGHIDDGPLTESGSGPGHTAAVIAVGGSDESDLPQLLPGLGAYQQVIACLLHGDAQLLRQERADGIAAAQDLEGVQAEAPGLVLHIYRAQPQRFGSILERYQGRGGIHGEAFVEGPDLLSLFHAQDADFPAFIFVGAADQLESFTHW